MKEEERHPIWITVFRVAQLPSIWQADGLAGHRRLHKPTSFLLLLGTNVAYESQSIQ